MTTVDATRAPIGRGARLRSLITPLGVLVGFAALLGRQIAAPAPALLASVDTNPDTDGDGLADRLEHQLGTLLRSADSDGDGYLDGEEVARGSCPTSASSIPETHPIDVALAVHSRQAMLHVQLLIYARDGELKDKSLTVVALSNGHLVQLPAELFVRRGTLESIPGREPGSKLFIIDLPLSPRVVYAMQQFSLCASVAAPATHEPGEADTLDLFCFDDVICRRFSRRLAEALQSNVLASTNQSGASGQFQGSGAQPTASVFLPVYRPNADEPGSDGGTVSSSGTPGQVCVQRTEPVGVAGGMIINEVVSAECVEGWDGFCSGDCEAGIGTLLRTIDPVTYSGG
jgi:Bacterial TSP3 repeat